MGKMHTRHKDLFGRYFLSPVFLFFSPPSGFVEVFAGRLNELKRRVVASRAQGTIVLNFVSDAVFLQNLRRDKDLSRFRVLCCKPFDPTLQHFTETRTSAATFLRMRRTRVATKRSHLCSTPLSTGIPHSPYNRKRKVLCQGLSHLPRQSTSAKHQLTRCTWYQVTTAPQKRHR